MGAESKRIRKNLSMLFTKGEVIKPLLDIDWLRNFNPTIRHIKKTTTQTDQSRRDERITQFEKLMKMNRTIKDTETLKK